MSRSWDACVKVKRCQGQWMALARLVESCVKVRGCLCQGQWIVGSRLVEGCIDVTDACVKIRDGSVKVSR